MTIQIDENHPEYQRAKATIDAERLSRAVFVQGATLSENKPPTPAPTPENKPPARPSEATPSKPGDSKAKD